MLGEENELKVDDGVVTLAIVIVGIGELFLVVCLAIVVRYYRTTVMLYSQRQILIAMTLCGMVGVGGLLVIPDVTDFSCGSRMWIVALPLFTMFNLLLGKTWRIWKIVAQTSFKKIRVPQYKVVL